MFQKLTQSDQFDTLQTIAVGQFHRVKLGRNKITNQAISVKQMKKSNLKILKVQQAHLRNEITILQSLSHPFIINYLGYHTDSQYVFILMEYLSGGDLFQRKDLKKPQFYMAQVVLIIEYLHSRGIIHRDIKPENCLLSSDGYIKLSDFSFAKQINEGQTRTLCGTPEYIAPEIIIGTPYGMQVDWWSLGILIYEMHEGVTPFQDEDTYQIYKKVLNSKLKFTKNSNLQIKSLCKKLIQKDPTKRMVNAKDIQVHCYFEGIDWQSIKNKKTIPPFIPVVKNSMDTSCYPTYPESDQVAQPLSPQSDPFFNW